MSILHEYRFRFTKALVYHSHITSGGFKEGRPQHTHTGQIFFNVMRFFRKLLKYGGLAPPSRVDVPFYENPRSAPD